MVNSLGMWITFCTLILSICSVWLPPISVNPRFSIPLWPLFFSVSALSGLVAGVLHALAIVEIGLFFGVASLARHTRQQSVQRYVYGTATALFALALALHGLPGFNNPVIISAAVFSDGAAAFTQHANYDKGLAGLVLLVFMCQRTTSLTELWKLLRQTGPLALATSTVVLSVALSIGYIKPDFKITQTMLLFLTVNLFFTVIAEETFFRGFVQEHLAQALLGWRYGRLIAALASALLFGVAHIAGGTTYMVLAGLAGLGYAYAYFVCRRIEAPIIIHFALNAVHCIAFTYPYLN